jgi:hypothetical protein
MLLPKRKWMLAGLALLALFLLLPCYKSALEAPAFGIYRDDGIYAVTAQALAQGRGYRILSTPDEMVQTKYPILFPALLAGVMKTAPNFPANLLALKLVPLLFAFLSLGLSGLWLWRQTRSDWATLSFTLALAASPYFLFLSTSLMSETLFLALSLGSLLLLGQAESRPDWRTISAAALLAAAAYHTRSIGICLILAGAAALAIQRQWRLALLFSGLCASLAAPWIAWQYLHRNSTDPYLSQANYYQGYNILSSFSFPEKLQILSGNLIGLASAPGALFAFPQFAILGLAFFPFLLRGVWGRSALAARLYLVASLTVILLWAWPPQRFVIPLLPLAFWMLWQGCPASWRRGLLATTALLFAVCWQADRSYSAQAERSGIWMPEAVPAQAWQKFQAQCDWLATHTPNDAIVQSNLHPAVYLLSGRKAVGVRQGNASLRWYLNREEAMGSPEEFRQELLQRRVTWILDTPWNWFPETPLLKKLLEDNILAHPEQFPRAAGSDDYPIHRFQPSFQH